MHSCVSSPNKLSYKSYVEFIETIKLNLSKITFLTQNTNQTKLVENKFGSKAYIKQIGMFTGEIDITEKEEKPFREFQFDFLYHNTLGEAKGILYFLELANLLPHRTFVIPYLKSYTEYTLASKIDNNNIYFIDCSWENGLKELILKSKITITPSLWSAPIEGALIKSMFYANTVAVVPGELSFSSEITDNTCIKLSQTVVDAAEVLENAIKNDVSLNNKSKKWIKVFINENIYSISSFIANKDLK
jgi:hypothetical protein